MFPQNCQHYSPQTTLIQLLHNSQNKTVHLYFYIAQVALLTVYAQFRVSNRLIVDLTKLPLGFRSVQSVSVRFASARSLT